METAAKELRGIFRALGGTLGLAWTAFLAIFRAIGSSELLIDVED